MPTYDYRCAACDHLFEHFQSIHSARLKKCPKCGKPKLERLIGAGGGLLFKGSGFYITDYRSSSYQEAAKKDSSAATDGKAKSGESSGESSASKSAAPSTTPAAEKPTASSKKSAPAAPAKSAPPSAPSSGRRSKPS